MSAAATPASADAPQQARSEKVSWAGIALLLASALLLLLGFRFDQPAASYDIDPSWATVVAWGAERGAQWGRDLVFTYGPLGWLSPQFSYLPSMLATAAVAQVALAALYAALFWFAGSALAFWPRLLVLALVVWFGTFWAGDVLWLTLHPLALLALWRVRERGAPLRAALAIVAGVACAAPWLAKFSLFPLWLLWLLCAPLALARYNRSGWLAAGVSVAASLLYWHLLGQDLSGLGRHIRTALQVAVGYADSMQRPGGAGTDTLGYLALAATLAALVVAFVRTNLRWNERIGLFALIVACTALAFKAAFTRVDPTHLLVFFPTAALMSLLACAFAEAAAVRRTGTAAALISALAAFALPALPADQKLFLAIGASTAHASAQRALDVMSFGSRAQAWAQAAEEAAHDAAMPQTRAAVGKGSVDIMSVGQGLLFLNRLDYRPRPVFQSYSAYSPELTALNRDFIASPRGPQWMVLDLRAIDGRLPTSEDPQAFLQVVQTYTPQLGERGMLLMRRDERAQAASRALGEVRARLDQVVEVPSSANGMLAVAIDIRPTVWNRAASALQRAPALFIDLELADGSARSFRIVPGAARAGFLLSPHIDSTQSLWDWLKAGQGQRVARLRLRGETWLGQPGFHSDYTLRFSQPQRNGGVPAAAPAAG